MASKLPVPECKEVSLLLLGKTGHGKSSTGNTILGLTAFKKTDSPNSNTTSATLNSSEREDGTRIRVVDTPGVMDTEKRNDVILSKICDAMSLCPNGFNALIFVVKFGIRYTKEERESLEVLKEYFGSRFLKDYGIVVMTQGDSFDLNHEEEKMTFKDWLKNPQKAEQDESFARLLKECDNRCVLFYNSGKKFEDKRKLCVEELLNLIKSKIPTPYNSEHIELATVLREKVVTKLGNPMLYTSLQDKLGLLIQQIHKDIRNNTFSYEKMLQNLDDLDKEVDSLRSEFKKASDFESTKESVKRVRQKLQRIFSVEEKVKFKAEQEQILKDLEILKEGPDRIIVILSKAFHMYAKILKPIGILASRGKKREDYEDLEEISKMMVTESIEKANKYVLEYNEAMKRQKKLSK